jgi:hypothetical protein
MIAYMRGLLGLPFIALGCALVLFGSVVGGIGECKLERLDDAP